MCYSTRLLPAVRIDLFTFCHCMLISAYSDAVRSRLNSLEAPLTLLKLASYIYPPMAWYNSKALLTEDGMEEWALRTGISSWAWRTLSDLNSVKDDPKDDGETLLRIAITSTNTIDQPLGKSWALMRCRGLPRHFHVSFPHITSSWILLGQKILTSTR